METRRTSHQSYISTASTTSSTTSPQTTPERRVSASAATARNPTSPLSRLIAARGVKNSNGSTLPSSSISYQRETAPSDQKDAFDDFLYTRGFLEGACSDITIRAFGKEYALHRLILDQSPFFSSLFAGPWKDSMCQVVDLSLHDDPNMTIEAFELAIGRLYRHFDPVSEEKHAMGLLAVARYLDMQDLIESSVGLIIRNLTTTNLPTVFHFATNSNYGSASVQLINSCKDILYFNGWEMGVDGWDLIPTTLAGEIISGDPFFVATEWDRCLFLVALINWHITHHPTGRTSEPSTLSDLSEDGAETSESKEDEARGTFDLAPLRKAMENGIYYVHFTFEQIQALDSMRDASGERVVSSQTLREAVWASLALKQKILGCSPNDVSIGLINKGTTPHGSDAFYIIPSNDETSLSASGQISGDRRISGDSAHENGEFDYNWTPYPPYRFSLEFVNVSKLREDKRVYSDTIWYAGSYWNIYIQKMRTKQRKSVVQMGVYLYRAKNGNSGGNAQKDVGHTLDFSMANMQIDSEGDTMEAVQETEFTGDYTNTNTTIRSNVVTIYDDSDPFSYTRSERQPPLNRTASSPATPDYLDTRPRILTYFEIFTPSRKGNHAITCFSSSPDYFNFSQSWGWKSTTLCAAIDEQLNGETNEEPNGASLKFTIVLGKV